MRRVVVTGMGMVTPLGCGVEPTWSRLIKGESGAKKVDTFEVSDLACKIACVIPRGDGSNGTYNPDQWMEPKEQRKVDDFIVFAMCAAIQALDDAGWKPTGHAGCRPVSDLIALPMVASPAPGSEGKLEADLYRLARGRVHWAHAELDLTAEHHERSTNTLLRL